MDSEPAIADRLRPLLEPYALRLVCAYLFGSQARGDATGHSDIDLAILYRDEPPLSIDGLGLDIAAHVEAATGLPVDLVVLNHAAPDLVHRVLRDGVLLLETDRSARIRFEVKARSDYFDVLPYLREYRRRAGTSHDRR